MRRTWLLLLAASLTALACEEDPARSMKIIARPVTPSGQVGAQPPAAAQTSEAPAARPSETPAPRTRAVTAASPSGSVAGAPEKAASPPGKAASAARAEETSAAATWRPPGCPPPPETSSGPSNFTVIGPCAFEHRAEVACEALDDDFLVTLTRKAAGGGTLMVFINVEHYKGPGDYTGAEIFVGLQDKANVFRWSSGSMNATVGKGEKFITMPETRLEWEPTFVNCTGPMTNLQCQGRGAMSDFPHTTEVISGTLRCQAPKLSAGR